MCFTRPRPLIAALGICGLSIAGAAVAGQAPGQPLASPAAPALVGAVPAFPGPPAPIAPEVITRDATGRATVRAVPITTPIRIDGKLDDAAYSSVSPFSGFIQMEPQAGAPASQKTDVWIFFDRTNVYVTARCWEDHPERMIANEMRRDSTVMSQNEHIVFVFDTFHDGRNGFTFMATPINGRSDGQVTNERTYNGDFNPIWNSAVGRFDGGWTVEAAIPFKSLRYQPGSNQIWGFNISRNNRWKNEISYLTRIPNALGLRGLFQVSLAATLVGLEVPQGSHNLEIKPYALANLAGDLRRGAAAPQMVNDLSGNAGVDMKYGITKNLSADLTYNTDFAQVEADEQQVNLTRFSLFFPEKREFFLENQGTFAFGNASTSGTASSTSDTPTVFYSRRIGLYQNQVVPIRGGGRVTGRVGRYSLGLLNIQSGDDADIGAPGTNFAVARLKRDILRRSSIGALVTRRSLREQGPGANESYGVDGTFGFFDNLAINTYWARTRTDGLTNDDVSYRAQLDYAGDRYGLQLEHLLVGDHFNPEMGFLRRDDMRKSYGYVRFSPRPKRIPSVRKFTMLTSMNYIENVAGRLESRDWNSEFDVEFQSSDKITLAYDDNYEFLARPFAVGPGVTLPVGGYDFGVARAAVAFGQQRRMSGTVSIEHGPFYNGRRTTAAVSSGRVQITAQFALQPSVSLNFVDLVQGSFTTSLVGARVTYTMTPFMFVSALPQYNSSTHSISSNVRFRWEYRPGSELFIVYNEQRDTLARGFPDLTNRAFIVKINRLLRP